MIFKMISTHSAIISALSVISQAAFQKIYYTCPKEEVENLEVDQFVNYGPSFFCLNSGVRIANLIKNNLLDQKKKSSIDFFCRMPFI